MASKLEFKVDVGIYPNAQVYNQHGKYVTEKRPYLRIDVRTPKEHIYFYNRGSKKVDDIKPYKDLERILKKVVRGYNKKGYRSLKNFADSCDKGKNAGNFVRIDKKFGIGRITFYPKVQPKTYDKLVYLSHHIDEHRCELRKINRNLRKYGSNTQYPGKLMNDKADYTNKLDNSLKKRKTLELERRYHS